MPINIGGASGGSDSNLEEFVDGLESSATSANTKLDTLHTDAVAISGSVDGLEANTASTNTKLDTIHADLTAVDGHVDGLETLVTSSNTKLDQVNTNLAHITDGTQTAVVSGTVAVSNAFALDATLTGGTQKSKIVDTGGTNALSVSAAGAAKVDGSAVTQPVSGTVAVSNAFALDATLTGGTQKTLIVNGANTMAVDSNNNANVRINSGSTAIIGGATNADGLVTQSAANSLRAATSPFLFNGVSFDRQRISSITKTAIATASGDTALWTPTTGKKFRLMAYQIQVTADAATAGGAEIDIVLRDATTGLAASYSVFVPAVAGTVFGASANSGWIDFGNGIISGATNAVLNINLSATLTAGKVRVVCCGTEE